MECRVELNFHISLTVGPSKKLDTSWDKSLCVF